MQTPQDTSGMDQQKSDREGMIQVNDLVYKLEPDISVAVNRTHKNHFFQQPEYKNSQPAICILNSGADYIDCRRSFLHFEVSMECKAIQILTTEWDNWHSAQKDRDQTQALNDNMLVHGYFGPNGSILNLIDTVTITTRSGDEISRVQDLALLANMTIPLIYGDDWRATVGGLIGYGEGIFGRNDKGRIHPAARRRFAIPLYLLSPFFQYGRLMPSMLMSGLRIMITWKSTTKAFGQFVARYPEKILNYGGYVAGLGFNNTFHVPFETHGDADFQVGIDRMVDNNSVYMQPLHNPNFALADAGTRAADPEYKSETPTESLDGRTRASLERIYTSSLVPYDGARGDGKAFVSGEGDADMIWPVDTMTYNRALTHDYWKPDYWGTGVESFENNTNRMYFPDTFTGGAMIPGYKFKGPPKDIYEYTSLAPAAPNSDNFQKFNPYSRRKYRRNPEFVEEYTILNPEFSLESVQLSDAIQRTLNEYSAVNGLEIVYTDYDLTTAPIVASTTGTSVYTEVRKSASRALQAFARITPNYSKEIVQKTCDSNASTIQFYEDIQCGAKGWIDYQWQLGSLYFPQQKVQARGAFDMAAVAYAYTLEAFDRFSGATSCMLKLTQGSKKCECSDKNALTRTQKAVNWALVPGAAPPDLQSQERLYVLGKPGSFQGGGEVIAVSLERSTLFNLSGIPINNSRVLALRGNYSSYPSTYCQSHTLNIYLKYVKLARIFLNNVEVEQ
jgi:hypothetical protein